MKITSEQTKKIKSIEDRWEQNQYQDVEQILNDYRFLISNFPSNACQSLAKKSKAVKDILTSVEKYNKYV